MPKGHFPIKLYKANDLIQIVMQQSGNQLREQSLQMLKDQAGRLRALNRQIELKEDQVHFLKETILALEQEKDAVVHQNCQLKHKLKTMANEITQYNANVVQKIYNENQQLNAEVQSLKMELQRTQSQHQQLSAVLQETQSRLTSESTQKIEVASALQSLKQLKSKNEKRVGLLQKQNKQLQLKNIALQRQLDDSSAQLHYCSQQIDLLTQKHHDSLKNADKKLQVTIDKMVPRQELQKAQREIKEANANNKLLKSQIDRTTKEMGKVKFQLATAKDQLLAYQIKEETRSLQLKTDFANLAQSVRIGKKIAEFQSEEHQTASDIYEAYKQCLSKKSQIQSQLSSTKNQLRQAQIQNQAAHQTTKLIQMELSTFRENEKQQQHSLQAQYQNKIMQISLRLKRQEIALAGLRIKQNELENVREQLDMEGEQHHMQKQVMLRTMQQIKKQNAKLSQELGEAVRMCEDNLWTRECISHYKLVLQNLVAVVFYMHLWHVRFRQRTRKLYAPFLQYYFIVHQRINPSSARERLRVKLKGAVHALMALHRMKKQAVGGRGLQWYVCSAVERREKIQNLSDHIENISAIVLKGGELKDVLKVSQQIYKWRIPNLIRVNLPMNDDAHQLQSIDFQENN